MMVGIVIMTFTYMLYMDIKIAHPPYLYSAQTHVIPLYQSEDDNMRWGFLQLHHRKFHHKRVHVHAEHNAKIIERI